MPRKKRNLEQINGRSVQSLPERYIYVDGNIRVIAEGLNKPLKVWTRYAHESETWDKVRKWLTKNKLNMVKLDEDVLSRIADNKVREWAKNQMRRDKDGLSRIVVHGAKVSIVSIVSEWVDLITPLLGVFDLTQNQRKELFSKYKESKIVKLTEAIEALDRLISKAKKAGLLKEQKFLLISREQYDQALKEFQSEHKRTGKNKLLYDVLKPVVKKLKSEGLSLYRQEKALEDLFEIFDYDTAWETDFLGRTIMRALKKQL